MESRALFTSLITSWIPQDKFSRRICQRRNRDLLLEVAQTQRFLTVERFSGARARKSRECSRQRSIYSKLVETVNRTSLLHFPDENAMELKSVGP